MTPPYKRVGSEIDLSPRIEKIPNAIVGPLTSGSKGIFPFEANSPCEGRLPHLRSRRGGQLVDVVQNTEIFAAPEVGHKVALYGGLLINLFGHFVAEGLQRLWPLFRSGRFQQIPIAFHSPYLFSGGSEELPQHMKAIFTYLGIDLTRIILISRATRFDTLYVPSQCSILGRGWVEPRFINLLADHARGRREAPPRRKHLFVGREAYLSTGSILGEQLLARSLQATGSFDIIVPEREAIADLVSWYEQAESIVFIEGSAIHALELCRTSQAKVLIICKGISEPARELHFGEMLKQKTAGAWFYDEATRLVPISALPGSEEPDWPRSSSYVNFEAVLSAIRDVSGVNIPTPEKHAIREACLATLGRLVLDSRMSHKRMTDAVYGKLLRELRSQVGADVDRIAAVVGVAVIRGIDK